MRNSSCEASAIRDWRCMRQAPCRPGCGRSTARGFCGPIRSAPDCSARPTAQRSPKRSSARRIAHRRQVAQLARPAAADRRDPAGAAARLRRAARHARDLRLRAARFRRWQPRHSDRGRRIRSAARCRWSNGCSAWSKASIRRSPPSRATACSSAPATPRGPLLGFRNLSEAGLDEARNDALRQGRVETADRHRPHGAAARRQRRRCRPGRADRADGETRAAPAAPPADRPTPDYEQPATSGEAPAEFALIDEFSSPPSANAAAERRVMRSRHPNPICKRSCSSTCPVAEAQPTEAPPSWLDEPIAARAPASAALHVADGCRRPLLARLRRIHPPDRRAHRRRLRPAVERDRRRRSGSIPKAASPRRSPPAIPGAASP